MKHRNLTISMVAALGMGFAGMSMAGSGYGHSSAMSEESSISSDWSGSASASGEAASSRSFGHLHPSVSSAGALDSESLASTDVESSTDAMSGGEQASASGSALSVPPLEPSLVFSDGHWYSYANGEWYALEDGEWRKLAESGAQAFHGTWADASAGATGYESVWYVTETPYYELVLYSTDGVEWYSVEGDELVAWTPIEVSDEPASWIPSASLGDSQSYSYYIR